jgi:tetratricopeptide (TPR) repeat protein
MESTNFREILQRADELERRGFRRAAIDVLEAELAARLDAGVLWQRRAVLLDLDGRPAEAFDNIQRALVLAPLDLGGWLVLAKGYLRYGHRSAAASVYLDLAGRELTPGAWRAVYEGLSTLGRHCAALAVCRRASQDSPDDDAIYFAVAHTLARLGRPPELSINVLRKAISLNPDEPRYRASLAIQLLRADRRDEAYEGVKGMTLDALRAMSCRCCVQKIMQLCLESGDAPRAATLAGRLAQLNASVASRQEKRA